MAEQHIKYLSEKQKAGEIWVASFVEATKYIQQKENSTIQAYYDGRTITVKLQTDNSKLNSDIFDLPMTTKIQLPLGWEMKALKTDDENLQLSQKIENKVNYILLDMLPNSEVIISCQ